MKLFHATLTLIVLLLISVNLASAQRKGEKDLYSKSTIKEVMKRVCAWQLANPVSFNAKNENDWARAAFFTGVMATYRTTGKKQYLNDAMRWSKSFDYKLADRLRHADDHAKGQTYLEIFEVKKDPAMISDIKNTFDSLILNPKKGREDR